jgi:hypothetical protein
MYKYTDIVYIYAIGVSVNAERFPKEGGSGREIVLCSTYSEAWTGLLQMH